MHFDDLSTPGDGKTGVLMDPCVLWSKIIIGYRLIGQVLWSILDVNKSR